MDSSAQFPSSSLDLANVETALLLNSPNSDDPPLVAIASRSTFAQLRPVPFISEKILRKSANKHMCGFYCYSIASEIYSIVSTNLFLPIALQQYATDNAFVYPDYDKPCPASSSRSRLRRMNEPGLDPVLPQTVCKVKILGRWVNTAAFPLYVSFLTVGILAWVIISVSNAGEDEKIRKLLLIAFAISGSLAGSFFFIIESSSPYWSIVGLLALISNVALGASLVFMNSLLSRISKEKAAIMNKGNVDGEQEDDRTSKVTISQCTSHISSRGIAYGFASGILALCLCLALVVYRKGDLTSWRWSIGGSALCWGLLTLPAAMWIPPSEFLSLRNISNPFQPIKSGKELFQLFKGYKNLMDTFKVLLAWAFLSNGYSTMTSTAILYAQSHLKMQPIKLILIGIMTPSMGVLGAFFFPFIQKRNWYFSGVDSNLKILKAVVIPTCAIPLYISVSMMLRRTALSTEIEMYLVASVFGIFYGGFQFSSRAVFTQLIPHGQEAKWNSLFSVTAKFSSCSGPLIVAIITEYTHDMRYGFLFILALFLISLVFLGRINMENGLIDAENYSAKHFMEETSQFVLATN